MVVVAGAVRRRVRAGSGMTAAYRGRFAPSPTGPLHLGSVLAACASWLDARAVGGNWLIRIEDIDPPRELPGASADILATLARLGMHSDIAVMFQSARSAHYDRAIERLLSAGRAFECRCSRMDLAATGGIHRGVCRANGRNRAPAIRLRVPSERVEFVDRIQGVYGQDLQRDVGDFVLRRADGLYAYQLAVVVDDGAQAITDVVRGADLLDSTPRQIYLQRCLDLAQPRYAHVPLWVDATGRKLSKQNRAPAIGAGLELTALRLALAALGQDDNTDSGAGCEQVLAAAAACWDIRRVRARPFASVD